jgi:hypothetical protein
MALRQAQGRLSGQPAEPALSEVEGMPALPVLGLLVIDVVVGLASALQRDLVVRERAAFRYRRSFGGEGSGFGSAGGCATWWTSAR